MKRRRGVALVLVLWLVVVFGVVGADVVRSARSATSIAANVRARSVARLAAESGIEVTVAEIEDRMRATTTDETRRTYLNSLEDQLSSAEVALGEARFTTSVIDANARLDLNATPQSGLATFFSRFTDLAQAADIARAIRSRIDGGDTTPGAQPTRFTRPFRSLEELRLLENVPSNVLERAAPYLTVDGDGRINRRRASDTVLVAATGELVEEPSRLVIVSRGWLEGHPLTHEIQAVYAISGADLVLVHWRERDR